MTLQVLDAIYRDDVGRTLPPEVDLHQKVCAAGEDGRVLVGREVLQDVVDMPRYVDAHAGIITSAFAKRSLGWRQAGGEELGERRDLEDELAESRAREAALADVLKDMSQSGFDLDRVLESVAMNAVRLCAADNGSIARIASDGWRLAANVGVFGDPEGFARNWSNLPIEPTRRSLTGRVLMDRRTTAIVDVAADPEYDPGLEGALPDWSSPHAQ